MSLATIPCDSTITINTFIRGEVRGTMMVIGPVSLGGGAEGVSEKFIG